MLRETEFTGNADRWNNNLACTEHTKEKSIAPSDLVAHCSPYKLCTETETARTDRCAHTQAHTQGRER